VVDAAFATHREAFPVTGTGSCARFRILRFHGRGGLGEVFIARDEELSRDVALKKIRPDRDGDDLRARFVIEAKVTGGLEHPGIVPVYSLGVADDGRPFYAMRFLGDDSLIQVIRAYHERHPRPDPTAVEFRRLLGRFVAICEVIAYAHSRGVLHRDLKPHNVMLGRFGETLIIDWGLARSTGQSDPGGAEPGDVPLAPPSRAGPTSSLPGCLIGSPPYMSPEQAAGKLDELGPATDVYGLGAILYSILTGHSPVLHLENEPAESVCARVVRGEIAPPRSRNPRIPRALEAVCLKALARRPEDRYPSARVLADDVERWLADEPVSARRDPLWTRFWRWVRKHRTLTAAAVSMLVIGLVAALYGYQRERAFAHDLRAADERTFRRLQEAIQANEDYISDVGQDLLLKEPRFADLRGRLLGRPTKYYERLLGELAGTSNRREQALLARSQAQLGGICSFLDRPLEARRQYEGAIATWTVLASVQPDALEPRHELANSYCMLGVQLMETGKLDEASAAHRKALALWSRLKSARPDVPEYQAGLAHSYLGLGNVYSEASKPAEGAEEYRRAIAIWSKLAISQPDGLKYENDLGVAYINLGMVIGDIGDWDEAVKVSKEAVDRFVNLTKARPGSRSTQHWLAVSYGHLGDRLGNTGDLEGAVEAYRKGLGISAALVDAMPNVPMFQQAMAGLYTSLGQALVEMESYAEAIESLRMAIAVWFRLMGDQPDVVVYQNEMADAQATLGRALVKMNEPKKAEEAYREAVEIGSRLASAHPDNPLYQEHLAGYSTEFGILLIDTHRAAEACEVFRKAVAIRSSLVTAHPDVLEYQFGLANSYHYLGAATHETGKLSEAVEIYQKALAISTALVTRHLVVPGQPPQHYQSILGGTLNDLGLVLADLGRHEEAIAKYREAITHQRPAFDRHPKVVQYRKFLGSHFINLARSLRALGRAGEAAEAIREHMRLWPGHPVELCKSAQELAGCIPIAGSAAEAQRYGDEAMQALRSAVAAGFDDCDGMVRELGPLRARDDFRELVNTLRKRTSPRDPPPDDSH
jgi:eukaryotic-like serine/threonine-protein kinase